MRYLILYFGIWYHGIKFDDMCSALTTCVLSFSNFRRHNELFVLTWKLLYFKWFPAWHFETATLTSRWLCISANSTWHNKCTESTVCVLSATWAGSWSCSFIWMLWQQAGVPKNNLPQALESSPNSILCDLCTDVKNTALFTPNSACKHSFCVITLASKFSVCLGSRPCWKWHQP